MIWTGSTNDVEGADGCPGCGETCADKLAWQDDERVKCESCGTVYRPQPED